MKRKPSRPRAKSLPPIRNQPRSRSKPHEMIEAIAKLMVAMVIVFVVLGWGAWM